MKKFIALIAVAAFVLTVTPVFAGYGGYGGSDVKVINDNWASVTNVTVITANTGGNEVVTAKGGNNGGGDITTGAATAVVDVLSDVNNNYTKVSGLCGFGCNGDVKVINDNGARVKNIVKITTDTGNNEIVTVKGGTNDGDIRTGAAVSSVGVYSYVNSNVTRIRR